MALTLRNVKGSPLTYTEMDNNLTYLEGIANPTVEGTYAEFEALITANGLTPGQLYLLNDYTTIYDQLDFDSVGVLKNPLTLKTEAVEPLILLAVSETEFSTKVWSTIHPKDQILYDFTVNQTYISNSPCKGRIIERIDEWNNRTDYDHRTVKFIRYDNGSGVYNVVNDNSGTSDEFLTFGNDYGTAGIIDNWIGNVYNYRSDIGFDLPNNVFHVTSLMYSNKLGDINYKNTWGDDNSYNTWGDNNFNNTWGEGNNRNTWGNGNSSNTWGNYNSNNTWGNYYNTNNTWGDSNTDNTWGNYNGHNTWGNGNSYNTWGDSNTDNTWGDSNGSNTWVENNGSNTWDDSNLRNTWGSGNSFNAWGDNNTNNTWGDSNTNNTWGDTNTRTVLTHILNGVNFTSATHTKAAYDCEIFKASDTNFYLKYFNSTAYVFVAPNA